MNSLLTDFTDEWLLQGTSISSFFSLRSIKILSIIWNMTLFSDKWSKYAMIKS